MRIRLTLLIIFSVALLIFSCGAKDTRLNDIVLKHDDSVNSVDNPELITHVITVDATNDSGRINKQVFGNNLQSIDPQFTNKSSLEWVQNTAASGNGAWDPAGNKPVADLMSLARDAGISIIRYASGKYRLENVINTYDQDGNIIRHSVTYGIDEFLETVHEIGAEPVIIIPIHPDVVGGFDDDFSKRAKHAADIVEYLNTPVGENPDNDADTENENIAWAEIRKRNGHPEPYHVKYFEIGNEPYARPNANGKPQDGGSGVDFNFGYGTLFNRLSEAMKAVDPSVQTGLSLIAVLTDQRNKNILRTVKSENLGYVILHMYFNQEENMDEGMDSGDAFLMNISKPIMYADVILKKFRILIEEITGRSDVPFAISEYNCWHNDSCHEQLSSALLNAELLKIFMEPGNNVLMANHWNMSNGLYGMLQNKNYINYNYEKPIHYIKRPNYYVYEMYKKYFGDILVDAQVSGDTYNVGAYQSYINRLAKEEIPAQDTIMPYLSVNASKNANGTTVYLMVINKHVSEAMTAKMKFSGFYPQSVRLWTLNGNTLDARNKESENVDVKFRGIVSFNDGDTITFPPHSISALIFTSDKTPHDWYNPEWLYRQEITIDKTIGGTGLNDFPVLIKITDENNPVFTNSQKNGSDILFTLQDGVTKLDHEIERYSGSFSSPEMDAWVRIPSLSSLTDTKIYMYYGSKNMYDLETPKDVWDSGFSMVQHLRERSEIHVDSTSNNNDYYENITVTDQGNPLMGKIGGADNFATMSDRVTKGGTLNNLFNSNTGTVEVWIKPNGAAKSENAIYKLPAIVADDMGTMGIFRGIYQGKDKIWLYNSSGRDCLIGVDYQENEWSHIVWLKSSDTLSVYKNGELYGSTSCNTGIGNGTAHLNIGRVYGAEIIGMAFTGIIDEVRVSRVDRSPGWIKSSYNIQNNPARYTVFGHEERN